LLIARLTGLTPYASAHALQQDLVARRRADLDEDVVLLLEHPETITLGRRPVDDGVLDPSGVPVVRVERGGFATWHAPGQLVGYPIVALDGERRDVHRHLAAIEDAVIAALGDLGVGAERDARNTGVWVGGRKVCSVGVAIRQWVSWHGLALNVSNDLAGFARIRPCGFDAEVMTNLAAHLDPCPSVDTVAGLLAPRLADALEASPARWVRVPASDDPEALREAILAAARRSPDATARAAR
jgi:lipoate-protein ligase B